MPLSLRLGLAGCRRLRTHMVTAGIRAGRAGQGPYLEMNSTGCAGQCPPSSQSTVLYLPSPWSTQCNAATCPQIKPVGEHNTPLAPPLLIHSALWALFLAIPALNKAR